MRAHVSRREKSRLFFCVLSFICSLMAALLAVPGSGAVCAVAALLTAVSIAVVSRVSEEQPDPYMDEIFHVPQAQNYCAGNYTHWNHKITTLPGLYVVSVLWVEPVARLLSLPPSQLCTTYYLRIQNAAFVTLNFLILCWLLKKLHKSLTTTDTILTSLSLSCLPVLYFSSLLYYTDTGGLLFVLMAYALSLSHHHFAAAFVSLVAVLFRQTNILWTVFIAGAAFVTNFEQRISRVTVFSLLMSLLSLLLSLLPSFLLSLLPQSLLDPASRPSPLLSLSRSLLFSLLLPIFSSLLPLWPYILVGVTFVAFVIWNGAIVVGDRSHHKMIFHPPQIFYFVAFSAVFSSPYLLGSVKMWRTFLMDLKKAKWIVSLILLSTFVLISLHYFRYEHSFLLSDNRHYTFYIWRRLLGRRDLVFYLVPVYSLTALFFIHALSNIQSRLWILLFSVVCLLLLTPHELLEFRYFIIPHIFLCLHLPPPSPSPSLPLPLLMELGLSLAVNVVTVWVFLNIPFHWSESDNVTQRFMW